MAYFAARQLDRSEITMKQYKAAIFQPPTSSVFDWSKQKSGGHTQQVDVDYKKDLKFLLSFFSFKIVLDILFNDI